MICKTKDLRNVKSLINKNTNLVANKRLFEADDDDDDADGSVDNWVVINKHEPNMIIIIKTIAMVNLCMKADCILLQFIDELLVVININGMNCWWQYIIETHINADSFWYMHKNTIDQWL